MEMLIWYARFQIEMDWQACIEMESFLAKLLSYLLKQGVTVFQSHINFDRGAGFKFITTPKNPMLLAHVESCH